jgi:hypothetical protein
MNKNRAVALWTAQTFMMRYAIDFAIAPHVSAHLRHASAHALSPVFSQETAQASQISAHNSQKCVCCADPRIIVFVQVWQISAQSIKSWICVASTCFPPLVKHCAIVSKQMRWHSVQTVMHSESECSML